MKTFLSILLLVLNVSTTFGQVPKPSTPPPDPKPKELQNVPNQVDKHEIERWGSRVVVSGEGMRAGEEVLFSKAMAPPEDDSDRWNFTVWGPSRDPATLAFIKACESSKLAAFLADPPVASGRKAWAHFNHIKSDDGTQKWRFEDYKIPLTGPFPVVTINPPRKKNSQGQFLWGDPTIVVDRIEAAQLTGLPPDKIFERIQSSVDAFCKLLVKQGKYPVAMIPADVDAFDAEHKTLYLDHSPGGSHAQYPWGPTSPPAPTPFNPSFPPLGPATPPAPVKLTFEQVKAAIPDAPADFVIQEYMKGYDDPAKVSMDWMLEKAKNPTPAPTTPSNWTALLGTVLALFGGGSLGGIIVWALTTFRGVQKATGHQLLIPSDATFQELLTLLQGFNLNPVVVPRTSAPTPTVVQK